MWLVELCLIFSRFTAWVKCINRIFVLLISNHVFICIFNGFNRALRSLSPTLNILSGSCAPYGSYPWTVQIQITGSGGYTHHCGGTILTEDIILTAAHCIDERLFMLKLFWTLKFFIKSLSFVKIDQLSNFGLLLVKATSM